MHKDQRGFGFAVLLIVAVVVIIIGVAAVVAKSRNKSVEENSTPDQSQTNNDSGENNTNTANQDQQPVTTEWLSDELANKIFADPDEAVNAYCEERNLNCNVQLLRDDDGLRIYNTGVDREDTEPGDDYYLIIKQGDGWRYSFLAGGGCQTGTDHPGLSSYCSVQH